MDSPNDSMIIVDLNESMELPVPGGSTSRSSSSSAETASSPDFNLSSTTGSTSPRPKYSSSSSINGDMAADISYSTSPTYDRHLRAASPFEAAGSGSSSYQQPPSPSVQAYSNDNLTKDLIQRTRVMMQTAKQHTVNAIIPPTTPTLKSAPFPSSSPSAWSSRPLTGAGSTSRSPTASTYTGVGGGGLGMSRRQLTGKNRAEDPIDSPSLDGTALTFKQAWLDLIASIQARLPSAARSGPKRVRTRTRRALIFLAGVAFLCYIFSNTLQDAYNSASELRRTQATAAIQEEVLGTNLKEYLRHPIEKLMDNAEKEWQAKVARQSRTADEGIEEYRRRYKMDPPDGFREWFEYAKEKGTVLIDEYDSLMAALAPFRTLEAAELRRRTFQIGLQPSFALVHLEQGVNGGTFWDANEDEELIKPFGVERARGFERMIQPFVNRPGMVNMVFAINELAEPRVLVPWEEKILIDQAMRENTTMNTEQFVNLPGKSKNFFPDPVWKGDGTTWEYFIRTCPPNSAARRVMTVMTRKVVHLADVLHVAYKGKAGQVMRPNGRGISIPKKVGKVSETVEEGADIEVQINPKKTKRKPGGGGQRRSRIPNYLQGSNTSLLKKDVKHDGTNEVQARPGQDGIPATDAYVDSPAFHFNANVTTLSHETLCNDPYSHEMQGQFCSDFRSIDSLYPVFSPSTMPGFADVVIPSHYYASTGPKYHLDYFKKKVRKAVKNPETGKWSQQLVDAELPPWDQRINKIFWRGSTTGGGNNPAGRQLNYQRHRFLAMTSDNSSDPMGVVLPPPYNSSQPLSYVELPKELVNGQTMDVAFTSLDGCGHEKVCDAVKNGNYRMGTKVPLMDVTKYKMLIDIDGMAYSARWLALLESGAAVLKSTIYSEFYSDQIQPWYHFIPISSAYSEIYNVYSYFLGKPPSPPTPAEEARWKRKQDRERKRREKRRKAAAQMAKDGSDYRIAVADEEEAQAEPEMPPFVKQDTLAAPDNQGAHEDALRSIGERGQNWQLQFGKNKDMEIYCYRLALEWGRMWQADGFNETFSDPPEPFP